MICLLFVFILEWALIRTQAEEIWKMTLFSVLILGFWAAGFAVSQKRNRQGIGSAVMECPLLIIIILSVAMGINLACVVWTQNHLSLSPVAAIDNGTVHLDTLYHVSASESFRQGFFPASLINDVTPLHYHTFSHLLLSILSQILGISVYLTYNWVYPVLFLPLYVFFSADRRLHGQEIF